VADDVTVLLRNERDLGYVPGRRAQELDERDDDPLVGERSVDHVRDRAELVRPLSPNAP
jgi:hypothetical protein